MKAPMSPPTPSVPLSEPEREQRYIDAISEKIQDDSVAKRFCIRVGYAHLWLDSYGLSIDDDGFIINADSGEFVVPYSYNSRLIPNGDVDINTMDNISVLFEPKCTEDGVVNRIHLSNMYSIIVTDDGDAHPIVSNIIDYDMFEQQTGQTFLNVAAWSSTAQSKIFNSDDSPENVLSIVLGSDAAQFEERSDIFTEGENTVSEFKLTCPNPNCEYTDSAGFWECTEHVPYCPECEYSWADTVTFCSSCNRHHSGTVWPSDVFDTEGSVYDTPICPYEDCQAGDEKLEMLSRKELSKSPETTSALDEYADSVEQSVSYNMYDNDY